MANNYTVDDWRFTSIGPTNLASKPVGVTPLHHKTGHHFAAQATAQLQLPYRSPAWKRRLHDRDESIMAQQVLKVWV
jgi:hypothetical protein